jgi:hypothetical protein
MKRLLFASLLILTTSLLFAQGSQVESNGASKCQWICAVKGMAVSA